MDPPRARRYLMKCDHGRERLAQAVEWSQRGRKDIVHRLAAYKAFQEAAEAAADLLAMALTDAGRPPTDDYSNVERAVREGILSAALAPAIVEATGLRNRLVHEYDGVDALRAADAIARLAAALGSCYEEVEAWMRSKT